MSKESEKSKYDAFSKEVLFMQYRECWSDIRQYDNLVWQIPSISTIVTGVLVALSTATFIGTRIILFAVALALNLVMTVALHKHQFFRQYRFREVEKIQALLKELGVELIADGARSTRKIEGEIARGEVKDLPTGWFYRRIAYNWIRRYMHLLTIVLLVALTFIIAEQLLLKPEQIIYV
ncbi:MAG: hypothetical protein NWE94_00855 [Candidatus Bathyarchaeota archaeon]|nr:hypothetical protein [Candidatus Bathyarchaeota archaeon]